ncbi:hypothetical protein [Parafilimonas terrae]|jgi:hypothetical protein|uniref:Uncharacterized protein n=1 Tax=Parafilimonas terrae TaxID=1465490 RepID=A0A1I5S3P3_9BACT|nr:hypothetical protein [Parafilimonas terrae]SFP65325.1 hypothetical protein SAMN05444277_101566 [Parafilimonas terrae]
MFKQIFTILVFLCLFEAAFAQNKDSLIHALLLDIQSMQVKKDSFFYRGGFPTYRECGGAPHNLQPDNTVFYTAITAFALRNMLPHLNAADKAIAENIIHEARISYPLYRNKHGYPYYGFWATKDPIMPGTYYFKYLKQVFGQGEDADDTVMILMTDSSSNKDVTDLKQRLIDVANLSKQKIIAAYKKYRDIPAYSTYLGSRTVPDFDFGVHCNILYFVLDKKLPFVKQDSATLQLITEMVRNREYMRAPIYLSPYYVRSSILIYHVVRLMHAFHIPELEVYKQQLIDDAKKEFDACNNVMDKIILSTSLMRLGVKDEYYKPPFTDIEAFEKSNQQQFIFFQARAAFSYPTPFKQIFLHWSYINYYFYCPAYYKTLWLENLVEQAKGN